MRIESEGFIKGMLPGRRVRHGSGSRAVRGKKPSVVVSVFHVSNAWLPACGAVGRWWNLQEVELSGRK
jgi:hypothetical protein